MNIQITLAQRYLLGRKMRTMLTTLAIVFGVAIIISLNGIIPAIRATFLDRMNVTAHQMDLIVTHASGGVFEMEKAEIVRRHPGVAAVSPALERQITLPAEHRLARKDGAAITAVEITGWDPETSYEVIPFRPVAGRWFTPGANDEMMLHQNFSEQIGRGLGDSIILPAASGSMTFRIVGLLPAQSLIGVPDVYIPLPAAQALFNLPGQINAIPAQFDASVTPEQEEALRQAIIAQLGPGFEAGAVDPGGSEWAAAIQMGNMVFTMFGVLALAMGGFIMFNSFRAAVMERRRDIGMLRAVGASRRTVMGLILVEGLMQGVVGTVLGIVLGVVMLNALLALANPAWQRFFNTGLGQPSYNPALLALAAVLGMGIPLLSGLIPARAASRITPLEALRPSSAAVGAAAPRRRLYIAGGMALVGVLGLASGSLGLSALGMLLFLSALIVASQALVAPVSAVFSRALEAVYVREGHLARGNLIRQPGRAAVTASAVMISIAILVALAGIGSTTVTGIISYLDKSMRADYLLLPEALVLGQGNVGAGPELAQRLRGVEGIQAVTTIRFADATAYASAPATGMAALMQAKTGGSSSQGTAVNVLGIDPLTYPQLAGLTFSPGTPESAYGQLAEGRYLLANGIYAAQAGLKPGSTVTLQTPAGLREYTVAGVGIDYLNSKLATVYISQDNLAADFRVNSDVLLMANRTPGASAAGVEAALLEMLGEFPAFTLFSYETWRAFQLESTRSLTYPLYLLMLTLAVPSLIALANTLGINVLERTREIGMMRAVGAARGQVRRIILAESLLLSALGISGGILAGIWLGYIMVGALNAGGMFMPYSFPFSGVLLAVAIGLLFGVLAALIPARHAARLNIVEALRYE
jgi:putative ABC transport system permease protein